MKLFGLGETFGLAGAGIGMGIIGSRLTAAGITGGADLTAAGATATGFISPMVSISGGGMVMRMLKDFGR